MNKQFDDIKVSISKIGEKVDSNIINANGKNFKPSILLLKCFFSEKCNKNKNLMPDNRK